MCFTTSASCTLKPQQHRSRFAFSFLHTLLLVSHLVDYFLHIVTGQDIHELVGCTEVFSRSCQTTLQLMSL